MNSAVLTIDDMPSKNTPAIVDYLCEKGIKVVMFATGDNLEKYYDKAKYALKKGVIVGNHSVSHPAFSALSLEAAIKEIEGCELILNRLYKDAGVERKYRPFRFPYGDKGGKNKDAIQVYLKEKGFNKLVDTQLGYSWWQEAGFDRDIDTVWTFDFGEYNIREGSDFKLEDVFSRMNEKHPGQGSVLFEENNRHILLLHAHDETEERVPEYYKLFIEYALEKGMTFEEPRFFESLEAGADR